MFLLLQFKEQKKCEFGEEDFQWLRHFVFRERSLDFSLESWAIRPSTVFGTRRTTVLRGEGLAWVPDLGSFLKLREVRVSPYLGFTLYLSVLQWFGLLEVLNGR